MLSGVYRGVQYIGRYLDYTGGAQYIGGLSLVPCGELTWAVA